MDTKVELVKEVVKRDVRHIPLEEERLTMARARSEREGLQHELKEEKLSRVEEKSKHIHDESQDDILKEAVKLDIKTQQKKADLQKAKEVAEKTAGLEKELKAVKGEKIETKSKAVHDAAQDDIIKEAVKLDIKTHQKKAETQKAKEVAEKNEGLRKELQAAKK